MATIDLSYEQVAQPLEIRAKTGQTISYNDFASELGLPKLNNIWLHEIERLKHHYAERSAEDHAAKPQNIWSTVEIAKPL